MVFLTLASCSLATNETTGPPPPPATTTTTANVIFFDGKTAFLNVRGQTLTVAVADTADERAQGLMETTDLGDLDGMLFVFDQSRPVTFTMRNTVIPLDIWFIDITGTIVNALEMVPCPGEPCPGYESVEEVINVLETPLGAFDFDIGDTVDFD